jgi:hypothetical protein
LTPGAVESVIPLRGRAIVQATTSTLLTTQIKTLMKDESKSGTVSLTCFCWAKLPEANPVQNRA